MATIAVEAETNGHKQIARFEKKLNIPDVRRQCHSVMSYHRDLTGLHAPSDLT